MWGIQGIFYFAICKLFCDKIALSQQQNLEAVKPVTMKAVKVSTSGSLKFTVART